MSQPPVEGKYHVLGKVPGQPAGPWGRRGTKPPPHPPLLVGWSPGSRTLGEQLVCGGGTGPSGKPGPRPSPSQAFRGTAGEGAAQHGEQPSLASRCHVVEFPLCSSVFVPPPALGPISKPGIHLPLDSATRLCGSPLPSLTDLGPFLRAPLPIFKDR